MSIALYEKGGLRFWTEREIMIREQAVSRLALTVRDSLSRLNPAWTFHRVEGPGITPREHISSAYDESDVWVLRDDRFALRAETTASSYLYAKHLLNARKAKLPLCVWQHGKSFRVEKNDGAKASELRFNEFYQCEFQCVFKSDSKADYNEAVSSAVEKEIGKIVGLETRIVRSDRLPSYSTSTMDVECYWEGRWKEACSISMRTDFGIPGISVLEVAVGTDRLAAMAD